MIWKIATCDQKRGFEFDKKELLIWWKYVCFEKGISPRDAKKTQMRDIRDIFSIQDAVAERKASLQEIQNAMNNMRS